MHKRLNLSKFYGKRISILVPSYARIRLFSQVGVINKSQDHISEVDYLPPLNWDRGGRTEKEGLTPLYASMRKIIDANPGCVCLIQVGSFYELYFEQAIDYASKLGLKVAYRKTNKYNIPMAGFPVYQLQKFVRVLVQELDVSVAIIDQYPYANTSTETIIHRKISRIVSPGTLIDESFLNSTQNNYLAAISFPANCTKIPSDPDITVGLSWIDLSVGEFYVQKTTLGDLMADISRINPSEIIISKEFEDVELTSGTWYAELHDLKRYFIRYHKTVYKDLKSQFKSNLQSTRKSLESFSVREEASMNMILSYINVNLPASNPSLDIPQQYWNEKFLQIDSRTREALELTERSTGGNKFVVGSLLSTIRRTVTPSGSRLLSQWIKSPILDVLELRQRQNFVSLFKENANFRLSIRNKLSQLGDLIRSIQKLSFGTGDNVGHLISIADGLKKLDDLHVSLLQEASGNSYSSKILHPFLKNFQIPSEIAMKISSTLDESNFYDYYRDEATNEKAPADEQEIISGNYGNNSIEKYKDRINQKVPSEILFSIKRDYDSELLNLHKALDGLRLSEVGFLNSLTDQIKKIDPKLSISKKASHGRYMNILYISGKQKSIEEVYKFFEKDIKEKRKGSLLYKSVAWSELQSSIDEQIDLIKGYENEIIGNLRNEVLKKVPEMRKVSKLVDYLDLTASFAVLAEENNLVCPKFIKKSQLNISGGRHIVVEASTNAIGGMFIPNDTKLGSEGNIWIITGPNMGGKSTYLRQNALIVILAQIGSFVPAKKASLGIVDKIFTRIGASDDLFSDLSTFMVEMVETSNILKNATPRSLAIVDEIGRGTSGKEGLAIAYATLLSLLKVNKCRTLFATHFGKEIDSLIKSDNGEQDNIRYFRTKVYQNNADINDIDLIIDHTLEPGISERSYALEVARSAGFPKAALHHAKRALTLLDCQ